MIWARWVAVGVALAAAGAVWLGWQQLGALRAENAALAHDLAGYKSTLAMVEKTAAIHSEFVKKQWLAEQDQRDLDLELQSMDGNDAPLSDYLRGAAGKLWR